MPSPGRDENPALSAAFRRALVGRHQVPDALLDLAEDSLASLTGTFRSLDQTRDLVTLQVLETFQSLGVGSHSLHGSTGYGYADEGRQACESVYARYFGADAALVRPQIASGTHALTCCLFGLLRPGDELLSAVGPPYDTMRKVIGTEPGALGTLADFGITYREVPIASGSLPAPEEIAAAIGSRTRVVLIQRSRGYSSRQSVPVPLIGQIVGAVKAVAPGVVCFVDNCYGEFVEAAEPTHTGADIVAGSLIKNPGGAIVPTGGYVVGRRDLVEAAASRLTAPGVGSAIGATLDMPRTILQGFFMAPGVVCEALKGAHFVAALFSRLGFSVDPGPGAPRTDIVQSVELRSAAGLVGFCGGVQQASPIDSYVVPEPWEMPGYSDPVIMAGGTFVAGSSIEMSADGALRPPHAAYFQGGVSLSQVIFGALVAASRSMPDSARAPGPAS